MCTFHTLASVCQADGTVCIKSYTSLQVYSYSALGGERGGEHWQTDTSFYPQILSHCPGHFLQTTLREIYFSRISPGFSSSYFKGTDRLDQIRPRVVPSKGLSKDMPRYVSFYFLALILSVKRSLKF